MKQIFWLKYALNDFNYDKIAKKSVFLIHKSVRPLL